MASINKVIIIGNLGKDPESRSFSNGGQVTNVTVATTDKWKDKQSGEMREATEWHRVVFSDRLAEIAGQYLRKGSQVYIEGSLRTRKWTDASGVEKYSTEIRADQMQMLSSRSDGGGQQQSAPQRAPAAPAPQPHGYGLPPSAQPPARQPAAPRADSGFDNMDDDIPF